MRKVRFNQFPELESLDLNELVERLREEPERRDAAFLYFEAIACSIACFGEPGARSLLGLFQQYEGDIDRQHAILVGLSFADPTSELSAFFTERLSSPHPPVIMAAIDGLRRHGAAAVANQVIGLFAHPSALVRAAAVRFTAEVVGSRARSMIEQAASDPDPIVRAQAVDAIDDHAMVELMRIVRRLAEDSDAHVRQAARTALDHHEG